MHIPPLDVGLKSCESHTVTRGGVIYQAKYCCSDFKMSPFSNEILLKQ